MSLSQPTCRLNVACYISMRMRPSVGEREQKFLCFRGPGGGTGLACAAPPPGYQVHSETMSSGVLSWTLASAAGGPIALTSVPQKLKMPPPVAPSPLGPPVAVLPVMVVLPARVTVAPGLAPGFWKL